MAVTILAVELGLQERKIKEALYIRKEKPSVNGQSELAEAMKFMCAL